MLLTLTVLVSATIAHSPIFLHRSDIASATLSEPGTYVVWCWSEANAAQTVSIAGQRFEVPATAQSKTPYAWQRIGSASIAAGPQAIELSEGIAGIALSPHESFDLNLFQQNASVLDSPDSLGDRRMTTKRDTGTVLTMPTFASLEEWLPFASGLRERMLLACGLWPMPEKTPLNPTVSVVAEHPDYIVERVSIEAMPGFLVTGNVYRPVGDGPFPAIVNPHGHWTEGRLENTDACSVPARCITFARMGIVAFSYDMIGNVDSLQFKHPWGIPNGEMSESRAAELKLWGVHPFALQLWSSVRALDYLESLPYVDRDRLGCTGASGGGTQTFALTAIDPRIKVSAPVNMISANMQGGCPCENAPLIRMGASNMEIGALMAPRPLLMVSATGDWTRETPRVEYPAIKSIFSLYGVEDRVESHQFDYGHNYNKDSRQAVYRFFGKWLLGQGEKYKDFVEPDYQMEPVDALRVFPDKTLPAGTPTADDVLARFVKSRQESFTATLPSDAASRTEFLHANKDLYHNLLNTVAPDANALSPQRVSSHVHDTYVVERWIIRRQSTGEAVPALYYRAKTADVQRPVLVVSDAGKADFADTETGGPGAGVMTLLNAGRAVLLIDTFLHGDHVPFMHPAERPKGSFPDTFLPTDTAYQVQDILTATAFLKARRDLTDTIDLVGLGSSGMLCMLAAAQDKSIDRLFVDANAFDTSSDQAWLDNYYVPCIRSTGGVATLAHFVAPRRLWLFGTGVTFDGASFAAAYALTGFDNLRVSETAPSQEELLAALTEPIVAD